MRTETAGGAYADQTANILGQLQSVYGTPGGAGTLETSLSNFTTALQSLSSNPGDSSAQSVALTAAQTLAQQLNTTTQGIQSLRTNVDQDIGNSAAQANTDMSQIAQLNTRLQGMSPTDPQAATLMDQRDSAVNDLSKLADVRVVTNSSNQANVYTSSGIQLVGGGLASSFTYSSPGALSATSLYNSDPTKSGVGSLNIKLPNGASIDVVANNVLSSGQIAADLKLRDQTLVQAQTQVDQLAATLSSSLSDQTTAGTAVTGPPAGFSVNTSNLLAGNTINLSYTNTATNTQQKVSIVNVTDPTALPLKNGANANPLLVGINFSPPMTSVVSQLNSALGGSGLQFSLSGSTLSVVGSGSTTVNAASTTTTTSSLTSGNPQLPLFTDSNSLYTGQYTGSGSQMTGLAGRITINPAVLANPVGAQRLLDLAGDRDRRQHPLGFPVLATDDGDLQLFAANRARLGGPAVQRHDQQLPAAIHQPAGQCFHAGDTAAAGAGRGGLDAAAEIRLHLGCQHRHRNGEFDSGAEYLRGQCPHHVGGPKHDAKLAAGSSVRRSRCRSAVSIMAHLCSACPCRISTTSFRTCRPSFQAA